MHDIADILGYEDASRSDHPGGMFTLGDIDADLWAPLQRWPVHNREDRAPIEPLKRALIHERDGNVCRHCGKRQYGANVLDHIVPRSAFPAGQLAIADRSDNLVTSCWDCNDEKSNFEDNLNKRPGVTPCCWDCANPWAEDEELDPIDREAIPELPHVAYCGRCGLTGRVPTLSWIL